MKEAKEPRVKKWKCLACGEQTEDTVTARADHLTQHNPTPNQWTDAHYAITAGKDRAKARTASPA